MKTVFVAFTDKNQEKLLAGTKTSTVRSPQEALKIGLKSGDRAIFILNSQKFNISCLGLVHVEEIGGRLSAEKTENFENNKPMFQSTELWLQGKIKLYYYRITKVKESLD